MENSIHTILDNLQTPLCLFDTNGEILHQNSSLKALISPENTALLIADILENTDLYRTHILEKEISGFSFNIYIKSVISDNIQLFTAEFIADNIVEINNFNETAIPQLIESNGRIVSVNTAFQDLIGHTIDTTQNITLKSLFYPAEIEKINKHKELQLEGIAPVKGITLHLKSKTHANIICKTIIENSETTSKFMFWDISNLVQKYDNLTKHYNRLLKLIDSLPVLLFAIDHNNKIFLWNKTATKLSGIERHIAINKNWKDIFGKIVEKNYLNKDFFLLIEKKESMLNKELELDLDGNKTVLSFTTFKNDYTISDISFWGIATDITELKQTQYYREELIEELTASRDTITQDAFRAISLNERLADSEEQLRQANATKDKFFSIIAHDLKGPIHSFTNLTAVILKDFDVLDKTETLELLQAIFKSAKQLTNLLENLLQWSRTQTNRINIQPENIHLDQLIAHNLSLLEQNAANKNISLISKHHGNQIAYADENMVYTVIRNLISNAIKFTHPGGKILVTSVGKSDIVEISVSDNGVGIRKEDIDNLFKIDIYHSTMGTQQETGTGLGLILCNEFIQKNQGKLYVESEIGKGSTFKFELPIGNNVSVIPNNTSPLEADSLSIEDEEIFDEMLSEYHPAAQIELDTLDEVLLEVILNDYIPQAKQLLETMLIDDINLFASKLNDLSKQYDAIDIIQFSEELGTYCENFDLVDIENNLNLFINLEKQYGK